jgi:hypothetical protein
MRNNIRSLLFGVVVAAGLVAAPLALARSHWNVGVNLGFPGVSIGYSDYGRGHGWGGNYGGGYYGGGYGYGYGGYGHGGHHSSHVSLGYYGSGYYGSSYYGPSYYGPSYYSSPASQVVYYDRPPVRRVYRSERRYESRRDDDRGYRNDYANRATYYDRGDDYRR